MSRATSALLDVRDLLRRTTRHFRATAQFFGEPATPALEPTDFFQLWTAFFAQFERCAAEVAHERQRARRKARRAREPAKPISPIRPARPKRAD